MSELINGKMPNIDDRVQAWKHYTFKDSGDTMNLGEMTEEQRDSVIRTIVHQKLEGVAYDDDMVPIENIGGAKIESNAKGVRVYSREELENFGVKFLRGLCVAHEINSDGMNQSALVAAILKAQDPFGTVEPKSDDTPGQGAGTPGN